MINHDTRVGLLAYATMLDYMSDLVRIVNLLEIRSSDPDDPNNHIRYHISNLRAALDHDGHAIAKIQQGEPL